METASQRESRINEALAEKVRIKAARKEDRGPRLPAPTPREDLVLALEGLVAFLDDLEATHCGLDDFTGNYPALPDALAFARDAIKNANR